MNVLTAWMLRIRGTRRLWQMVLLALDASAIVVATLLAYYARFEGVVPYEFARRMPLAAAAALVVYLGLTAAFGLYRVVLRYVGVDALLRVGAVTLVGFAGLSAADLIAPEVGGMRPVPLGVLFIQALLVLFGIAGIRLAVRFALHVRRVRPRDALRVLIIGAGSAGCLLLRDIQSRPHLGLSVVGFLDDDRDLHGRTIDGVAVIGPTSRLAEMVRRSEADEVLVALPGAPQERVRAILNAAADAGVKTRVMPQLVVQKGSVSLTDLRKVEVEDLLGREPTPIDVARVADTLAGRVVGVTGAAGSIGAELCRQILETGPARLLLLEVDETRLYELWLELEERRPGASVMSVCDIRDEAKLDAVFAEHRPAVVLHAAAYKHVPVMEVEPAEAVKTNVLGTQRVVEACRRHGVERFVLVSTDKAVAPANVMGYTKHLAEEVMLSASGEGGALAVAVRFGNVLGSRGSVVPIFEEQLRRGGPLTVTDREATRYFMTIPEAARLVLQAQAIGRDGDVFVLDMGEPVRILDLARKMVALSGVPADIEFVGLRPGEKLHESLVHEHEELEPTGREKILRVVSPPLCDTACTGRIGEIVAAALDASKADVLEVIDRLDPAFATRRRSLAQQREASRVEQPRGAA
ncbi:MAG: polysaccharide biosynthesis protein [Coriobacteriia bacterium]|nr:polysaccharide biosynthesis protein [Coriobacteriia bacterium]